MGTSVTCRVCGARVDPSTGAGVRVRGEVYAVCEEHAPWVRGVAVNGARIIARSTRTVLERRAPRALEAGRALFELANVVRGQR